MSPISLLSPICPIGPMGLMGHMGHMGLITPCGFVVNYLTNEVLLTL
jgi:hypothetical protein